MHIPIKSFFNHEKTAPFDIDKYHWNLISTDGSINLFEVISMKEGFNVVIETE